MDLSIVIVSYNTLEMLRACLLALPDATKGLETEIFVVDNASPDDSVGMVHTEFPEVRLIANRDNAGFTRANNQALRQSKGRHVVILNPDTEAEPDSLTRQVDYLDAHPETGAVGPMLLNSDGSLQHNGRRFPTPWRDFLAITGLGRLRPEAFYRMDFGRDDFDTIADVDQVMGACLMVRREAMEQVGMLDEDFYMFYEEVEWCWRIKRAGWKVTYLPEARVVHHHMGSVRQRVFAMSNRLVKSAVTYYDKTAAPSQRIAIRFVALVGYAKNALIQLGVRVKRLLRAAKVIR